MKVSPARAAAAAALGAWALLFWFLLLTDRSALYVGTRTAWVVPTGAVVLTVAAAGRLLTLRTDRGESISRRRAWGLGFVILPVVVVLALPPTTLGSFAAGRRSVRGGFVSGTSDVSSGEISLADVAAAMWSDDVSRQLVKRAGSPVSFVGIVTRRDGQPADEFMLTRFIVTCCVADALSVQVRVVGAPPGKFDQDMWVKVDGRIFPLGEDVVLDATTVRQVPRPKHPYLNV